MPLVTVSTELCMPSCSLKGREELLVGQHRPRWREPLQHTAAANTELNCSGRRRTALLAASMQASKLYNLCCQVILPTSASGIDMGFSCYVMLLVMLRCVRCTSSSVFVAAGEGHEDRRLRQEGCCIRQAPAAGGKGAGCGCGCGWLLQQRLEKLCA
jgi:hypothetical protein